MATDRIRDAIIEVTAQIQSQSQRDMPALCGSTRLIGDVPGFDSLNAVELVILLSDALSAEYPECNIPDRVVLGAGRNARPTLDEVVTSVRQHLSAPVKKTNQRSIINIRESSEGSPKEKCNAYAEI